MGIGDAASPVADDVEPNNPVPRSGDDRLAQLDARLTILERTGNSELVRQIRYLYDVLSEPYPPP